MVDPDILTEIAKRQRLPPGVGWVALVRGSDTLLVFEELEYGWMFSIGRDLPSGERAEVGIVVCREADPELVPKAIEAAVVELDLLVRGQASSYN